VFYNFRSVNLLQMSRFSRLSPPTVCLPPSSFHTGSETVFLDSALMPGAFAPPWTSPPNGRSQTESHPFSLSDFPKVTLSPPFAGFLDRLHFASAVTRSSPVAASRTGRPFSQIENSFPSTKFCRPFFLLSAGVSPSCDHYENTRSGFFSPFPQLDLTRPVEAGPPLFSLAA